MLYFTNLIFKNLDYYLIYTRFFSWNCDFGLFADQYHPVLDSHSKIFLQQARQFMAQATLSSALRFQNFELTYDDSRIFLIGTIVEQAPFIGMFRVDN